MSKDSSAWITVSTTWIQNEGLSLAPIFKEGWATSNGDAVIEVLDYNLSDNYFVELKLKPAFLNHRAVKILVPRLAILNVFAPSKSKDASLLGFKRPKPKP